MHKTTHSRVKMQTHRHKIHKVQTHKHKIHKIETHKHRKMIREVWRWTGGRDDKYTVENHDYVPCISTQAKVKDHGEEKMTLFMTLQG